MKKLVLSLILFILLFTVQVNAVTRYIDFSVGNDANDGITEGEAWLTESYAYTQISTADVLRYVQADWGSMVLADWEALHTNAVITQTKEIKQWAITWTISGYERFGQYATGDFWIYHATSITITEFTPNSTDVAGRTKNGTMINPTSYSPTQGYDNEMGGETWTPYNVSYNKAYDIVSGGDNLVVATESSICSTVSRATAGLRPQLSDASILTVVDTVPSTGDFRPPFCGTDKTSNYNVSAFVTQDVYDSILGKIDAYGDGIGTIPSQAAVERWVQRPWLSHMEGSHSRYVHPLNNMPEYDTDFANQIGAVALWLNLLKDVDGNVLTDADKRTALVGFLQLGIDFVGVMDDYGSNLWENNKGSGRKWPIIFAGVVFNDANLYNIDATYDFKIDLDTFYVNSSFVLSFPYTKYETGSGDRWGNYYGSSPYYDFLEYTLAVHDGMPDWSPNALINPNETGANLGRPYRYKINPYYGICLAAQICNYSEPSPADWGRTLWADESLFDYMDRYADVGPIGGVYENAWLIAMYAEYRSSYATIAIPVWTGSYDVSTAATPTVLAQVPDSNTYNSITVSWSGAAAVHDISTNQTTAYLGVTSPYIITGLNPNTSYEIEVWGKKANGIRSLIPDELTVTTAANPSSLIAHYKMDDAAGQTVVADATGNNFTGTAANNIVSVNGKVGNAITFNGTDDSINYPSLGTLTQITVAGWFKTTDTSAEYRAFSHNATAPYISFRFNHVGTANKLQVSVKADAEETLVDTSLTLTGWNHIAITAVDGGDAILYVNGILSTSAVSIGTFSTTTQTSTNGNNIGSSRNADTNFKGDIDDVRIYNEALTASQVKNLAGIDTGRYGGAGRNYRRSRYE